MGNLEKLVGSKTFKQGSQGDDIRQIQLSLRSLGYDLQGTGYFGGITDVAVTEFQRRAGLKADGVVGPATARAIDVAVSSDPIKEPPAVSMEIGRPLWLTYGLTLIGTKETPGGGDTKSIMTWAHEEGGAIAKEYTHDVIPWCALFANHILTKASLKGTETLWALDFAGNWPSKKLSGPAVGAFAPMLRNGGGHIICIVGRDQHGNVMGLGGNQSDAVNIKPFSLDRLNKGFWWPESVPLPITGFNQLPIVKSDGKVSLHEG